MANSDSILSGPYFYLGVGIAFFSAGVVWTYTGELWARFGRIISRAEDPKEFWAGVIACYLIGVCFIAAFLVQVYSP